MKLPILTSTLSLLITQIALAASPAGSGPVPLNTSPIWPEPLPAQVTCTGQYREEIGSEYKPQEISFVRQLGDDEESVWGINVPLQDLVELAPELTGGEINLSAGLNSAVRTESSSVSIRTPKFKSGDHLIGSTSGDEVDGIQGKVVRAKANLHVVSTSASAKDVYVSIDLKCVFKKL